MWIKNKGDQSDKPKSAHREKLLNRMLFLIGAFWVSPKGKVCRIEAGGLSIEETNSGLPWGDIPLSGLEEILKDNEKNLLKPQAVTESWARNRIRERKERGENTANEEALFNCFFGKGPVLPEMTDAARTVAPSEPVVAPTPPAFRGARPEAIIEEVPF